MSEALQRAVDLAGGQTALATSLSKATGKTVNQPDVWYWLNEAKKGVPAEYCGPIEEVTSGKIRREELRPDIFGEM